MSAQHKATPCCGTSSHKWRLAALVLTATMGGLLLGFDTEVINGAMLQLRAARDPYGGLEEDGLSNFQQETIVSGAAMGAIVGASVSGWAADRLGRRSTLMVSAAIFMVGALVMGFAPNFFVLLLGRLAIGLSVGSCCMVVPVYIAEAAPASRRGSLVALNTVMIVLGQVLASLVDCALAKRLGGWRWMLGLGNLPAAVMIAGLCILPESPRWLVQQGRREEALSVLCSIRSADVLTSQADGNTVQAELEAIEEQVQQSCDDDGLTKLQRLQQIFSDARIRTALVLGCVLQLAQQFSGINAIMCYSATIFQAADPSADDDNPFDPHAIRSVCLTAGTATANLLGNLLAMCIVERAGRRALVLGSLGGACASLALLGIAFHPGSGSTALAFVAMVTFLLSYGCGLAPIPWVVNSEIYPIHARSLCGSIATGVNWAANLFISLTFLDLAGALSTARTDIKHHPDGVFWLYALLCVVSIVWLCRKMPETKGLSLEQMSGLFDASKDYVTQEDEGRSAGERGVQIIGRVSADHARSSTST